MLVPKKFCVQQNFGSERNVESEKCIGLTKMLGQKLLTWPVWFNQSKLNLTCHNLVWSISTWLTCPDLIFDPNLLDLSWPDLTSPDLTRPVPTWSVLTWSVLTRSILTWPVLTYLINIQTSHIYPSETLQAPSRRPYDTLQTATRQPPDNRQTPSRHPQDSHQSSDM